MPDTSLRYVITGGAGLVGQNLVVRLREAGCAHVCVIDRHAHNLAILRELDPGVETHCSDMRQPGPWQQAVRAADVLVLLHAQIGGIEAAEFVRNNVEATRAVLGELAHNRACYVLHVSSSVVNSRADDEYVRTKRLQEELVRAVPNPWCVLRPTLMFGWFDRKHFGWLSRFMRRSPLFPVPGHGEYLRQPLFAGDFCRIILRCIERRPAGECFDISGKEKLPYIRLVRMIRAAVGSRTLVLRIPYGLFAALLGIYACFDRDPPFTVKQLEALVIDETFPDTDWETVFDVRATPLAEALAITFRHPVYSAVALRF